MYECGCLMDMTISPFLLANEVFPFLSLSFDSSLAIDTLTGSYFLFPVSKFGPESVTAASISECELEKLNCG